MAKRKSGEKKQQGAVGRPGRSWLPWAAGVLAVGLFLSGGFVFAQRSGALGALPGFGPPELENELAGAESPYLRSAAEQPVVWQRWGPKAFELAKALDRPVWLDIGAIWCHWCHVMDRESYENPEIAALINQSFVPVKVDRDQRPDIDARYQAAHRVLNDRGGGWPLTMWLTPDGEAFSGGTYFPPENRGGRPGLREMIPQIAGAFHGQRDRVAEITAEVRGRLDRIREAMSEAGTLTPELPRRIAAEVGASFDTVYGGFGDGQKFPHASAIRLVLAEGFLAGDQALLRRALRTLDAYAVSGMYDHVRGGFFRYSTDRRLTVPHFEKMDYVQAGLLRAYLDAHRLTGEERYAAVARDIMRYVDATLSDREGGGFYAHQDADISLDDDGSYYTWSLEQLREVVPAEEAEILRLYYGIEGQGEMREDPTQHVLRIVRDRAEVAAALGITEAEALRHIREGTERLAAAREGWKPPLVDVTAFTDRNGMMAAAYLEAWASLGDEGARDFALRSLDFLLEHVLRRDGSLLHATEAGESHTEGMMADYAYLADALADAYQVSGRERYLQAAERVMDRAVALFWDEEGAGFFDRRSEPDAPGLLARQAKKFTDSPLPGDNAVAARALEKLYLLTSRPRWGDLAQRTLAAFAGSAEGSGTFAATYALVAEMHTSKPPQTVVIGPAGDPLTGRLAEAAWRTYRPGRLVATYDPETVVLDSLPEAVAGAARATDVAGRPQAFVCVGQTCAPPTSSPEEVSELVRDYGRTTPGGDE